MKQKEYVCGYSDCIHKGEKVPSEIAVKDGTRYYHPDCHKEKSQRNQIFDIYYKYYKSTEDFAVVRKAIKSFCQNSSSEYVLYVLCQAIHQKIPFKGIFTLGWLVKNDMNINKKYRHMKSKQEVEKINFNFIETITTVDDKGIENHHKAKKNWADTLFG